MHFIFTDTSTTEIYTLSLPDALPILILALPNYTSYDASFYQGFWAAYDPPRHLYHFNPAVIAQLCDRHGLHLLDCARMPLDSFYVSMLSEKYKGDQGWLARGLWVGLRSLLLSLGTRKKSSSIIYLIRTETLSSEANE